MFVSFCRGLYGCWYNGLDEVVVMVVEREIIYGLKYWFLFIKVGLVTFFIVYLNF